MNDPRLEAARAAGQPRVGLGVRVAFRNLAPCEQLVSLARELAERLVAQPWFPHEPKVTITRKLGTCPRFVVEISAPALLPHGVRALGRTAALAMQSAFAEAAMLRACAHAELS